MSKCRILLNVAVMVTYFGVTIAVDTKVSEDKPPKRYTQTITTKDGEKLSFEMILIPSGTFLMGSPAGQAGRQDHEGPQHQVCLDPFYLCTTETTIELFLAYYQETVSEKKDFVEPLAASEAGEETKKNAEQANSDDVDAITGPTPVYGDLTMGYEKNHPAMGMTWHNAMTFCRWLSKKTGREYRLPTEAEWEYACRAGSTSVFGLGGDPNQPAERVSGQAGQPAELLASQLGDYAWYGENSQGQTHETAKKKPNVWGLYDMLGNVCEWVYDFYSPTEYQEAAKKSPAVNPTGPKSGKVHVARGGNFNSPVEELRCAARAFEEEWWRSGDPQIPKSRWWLPQMEFIGFRVAHSVDTDMKGSHR